MKRMEKLNQIILDQIMFCISKDLDPNLAFNTLMDEYPVLGRYKRPPLIIVNYKRIYQNAKEYYETEYDVLDRQGRLNADEINATIKTYIKNNFIN